VSCAGPYRATHTWITPICARPVVSSARTPAGSAIAFQIAVTLAPAEARLGYVYGLALIETGQLSRALNEVEHLLMLYPYDTDCFASAADLSEKSGRAKEAPSYAQRLLKINPEDPNAQTLVHHIRDQSRRQLSNPAVLNPETGTPLP